MVKALPIMWCGAGSPKLITVYGMECIQKADVILYDRLAIEEAAVNERITHPAIILVGMSLGYGKK